MSGCRYASERGGTTGRSTIPSPRTHRPAHHPINDTREASQLSDLSPRRGARQQAQRGPKPSAKRWACPSGLRPAPKGCLALGQPECSERATRRESSLLERHPPTPARSAHDAARRGLQRTAELAGPLAWDVGCSAITPTALFRNSGGARTPLAYTVFTYSLLSGARRTWLARRKGSMQQRCKSPVELVEVTSCSPSGLEWDP